MNTKYITIVLAAVLMVTGFSGCSLLRKRVEKTEKVEFRLSAVNKTKISLDDSNGDIKVTRSNDSGRVIQIDAVKSYEVRYDEQDKPLDMIKINIDSSGNEIKITTEIEHYKGLFNRNKGGKVDFNIKIPANLNVEINNVNGDITLAGIDGDVNIETVNSTINIAYCSGSIKIDGVNSGVRGNFDSTKGINIELVNGLVKLGGLKNISADLNASTVNGKVKVNNLILENMVSEKRSLTGTLGKGGSDIKISTVNGNITFEADKVNYKKDTDINFKIDFNSDDKIKITEGYNDDGINVHIDGNSDDDSEDEDNKRGQDADTNKTQDKKADSLKKKQ